MYLKAIQIGDGTYSSRLPALWSQELCGKFSSLFRSIQCQIKKTKVSSDLSLGGSTIRIDDLPVKERCCVASTGGACIRSAKGKYSCSRGDHIGGQALRRTSADYGLQNAAEVHPFEHIGNFLLGGAALSCLLSALDTRGLALVAAFTSSSAKTSAAICLFSIVLIHRPGRS